MKTLFYIISGFLIVATLISLLFKKNWWIRVFDFPRVQIMTLQAAMVLILLWVITAFMWYDYLLITLLIVALIVQLFYVFPYLPFAPKTLENADISTRKEFSIIAVNVLMKNRKYKKLFEQIRAYKPDLLVAVETDEWWVNKLKEFDFHYNTTIKIPQEDTYGMVLYSKLPLRNTEVKYLIKNNIPSIHTEVNCQGFVFNLKCLHPEPPMPDEAKTSVPRDRELFKVAQIIRAESKPQVVVGDLNDVAWSYTSYKFDKLSHLKDPRKGRGFFNTFHAKIPFMRWALDHIFVSKDFKVIQLKRLPRFGSDHFPMYFKFGIRE